MKNILIAITTLLLLAGAGAGGYFYGIRGSSAGAKAGSNDVLQGSASPNFPEIMTVGDEFGSDCVVDFNTGAGSCTYADGSRQTISRSGDVLRVETFGKDGNEGTCATMPVPTSFASTHAGGGAAASPASFIRPGAETKRIKSWVIQVPDELNILADDGVGIHELEYFEKDGDAWRAEFFEDGKDEPTIVQIGAGKEGVSSSVSSGQECTAVVAGPGSGRALFGDFFGQVAAGIGISAYMGFFCAAGPHACAGAGLVAVGVVIAATCCCRRRRRSLLAAPTRMLRLGGNAVLKAPGALLRIGGTAVDIDSAWFSRANPGSRLLASTAVTMAATSAVRAAVAAAGAVADTPAVAVAAA